MPASSPPEVPPTAQPGRQIAARRVQLPQYGIAVGPLTHLHTERRRLANLSWRHFAVHPVGATIGGELRGIDLRTDLPDAVIDEIRQALLAYKVIFFRDQMLTSAEQVAFARRFGDLELHPFIPANPEQPNLVRFEKSEQVGGYENGWHADVTWRECPSLGAILRAVELPPSGGDTLFADMYAAYEGLDDDTKLRIAPLQAEHDFMPVFGASIPPGLRDEMRRRYPVVHHPVVRTHPETGRKLLFVNRFFTTRILGLAPDDSRALLDRLSRQADTIEYQCRFRWTPHAIAFWDNRAAQHYACSDYWPDVRVMERASIIGDRPV
jgi:alpha-ketoglutarate-dependent sulfate ester dioxygenase